MTIRGQHFNSVMVDEADDITDATIMSIWFETVYGSRNAVQGTPKERIYSLYGVKIFELDNKIINWRKKLEVKNVL